MPASSLEYMQLETRSPGEGWQATYYFDLHPDLIEGASGYAFRLSDCLHTPNNPQAPGWVGVYGTGVEPDEEAPFPFSVAIVDDENRPEGAPLRCRKVLPFLEPRYGDGYVVFIIYPLEED